MIKEEIVVIDIKMSDGKVLRCNGYEKSLEEAIETIQGKLDELRFDKTVAGRLRTTLMELWNQEVTADFFARELVRRGWTDEKPEPELIALSDEEVEAIRVLHDAAVVAVSGDALTPMTRRATQEALEIVKRFQP